MLLEIKKIALTFVILSAVAAAAFGQVNEGPVNSLTISLGADHHRLIDQAFSSSRLKFTGTSFSAVLSFRKVDDTYFFETLLQGTSGQVAAGGNALTSEVYRIHLDLSYARGIVSHSLLNMQNKGYMGVQISSFNSAISNEEVLENVSITSYHTLNLLLYQITRLDETKNIQLKLALPVLGWTKRSIYDGGANKELENSKDHPGKLLFHNSRFSFINPLAATRINIAYIQRLTPKIDFSIEYLFNYLHDKESEPIRSYQNGLLAGLKFNF